MINASKTVQNITNDTSRTFRVVINRTLEDDGYIADIPSIKHCMAFGDTIEEAMANLYEALEGTLEVMMQYGTPIPDDTKSMEMIITVPINKPLSVA